MSSLSFPLEKCSNYAILLQETHESDERKYCIVDPIRLKESEYEGQSQYNRRN